jgi:hypothetical protein
LSPCTADEKCLDFTEVAVELLGLVPAGAVSPPVELPVIEFELVMDDALLFEVGVCVEGEVLFGEDEEPSCAV